MKTTTLDTKEASNKFAAYTNARQRSKTAQQRYTAQQQLNAQNIFETVRGAYIRSVCYLTYRNKFITVKVNKPTSADKLQAHKIEAQLASANVTKIVTAQGIVYRF